MYGKKLKLTRDDFIKLHQDYYKGVFENSKNQNAKIFMFFSDLKMPTSIYRFYFV